MTIPVIDAVTLAQCEQCEHVRAIAAEREASGVRVTVLSGCAECSGSYVILTGVTSARG